MLQFSRIGIALKKYRGGVNQLQGEFGYFGTGWKCDACGYESKTVFTTSFDAGLSEAFHQKSWCEVTKEAVA